MAKPQLSVELTNPDGVYRDGDTVAGVVRVQVDKDINCNGLEISCLWRTHGRGNVASGTRESLTAFSGQWRAGEQYEYPFDLKVADWPPTYHGHHLNVDHYVEARAKLAWAFDPKASTAFLMRPTQGPKRLKDKAANSVVAQVFVKVFFSIIALSIFASCAGLFAAAGPLGFLILLVPLAGLIYWFVRHWLPKYVLGEVECEITDHNIPVGGHLRGELVMTPKRSVSLNGIVMKVSAMEKVISGSGSNKSTHRHEIFTQDVKIADAQILDPGVTFRHPIEFQVPQDAACSIEVSSNQLYWEAKLRIDIARWPDWIKKLSFVVVPSSDEALPVKITASDDRSHSDAVRSTSPVQSDSPGITFEETMNHLWQSRDDDDHREMLVDAVTGMSFAVSAIIERRLLYAGDHDANPFPRGHSVWARFPDPELPLVLFVPHDMGEEFEHLGRQTWTGQAKVVGWDRTHGRLQLKVES